MDITFEISGDEDRKKWVQHNPWLYNQWKMSKLEIDEFVRQERPRIDAAVKKMAKVRTNKHFLSSSG